MMYRQGIHASTGTAAAGVAANDSTPRAAERSVVSSDRAGSADPADAARVRLPLLRESLRARLVAAGLHLLLSALAASAVLALVFGGWYPAPFDRLVGVGVILVLMLSVDVVLGPLCTAIVFDRSKPRLRMDLAVIATIQAAALAFGVWTVHQGRPAWIVFVKDRFEIVSPADVSQPGPEVEPGGPRVAADPLGPRWVAARMPSSEQQRYRIMFESAGGGRDVQHYPELYLPYESQARAAVERSLPIARLRAINVERAAELAAALRRIDRPEEALRYLPVRGPAGDGAAIIDAADGRVLGVAALVPW